MISNHFRLSSKNVAIFSAERVVQFILHTHTVVFSEHVGTENARSRARQTSKVFFRWGESVARPRMDDNSSHLECSISPWQNLRHSLILVLE